MTTAGSDPDVVGRNPFDAPAGYTGERLAADDPRFRPDLARHFAAYELVGPLVAGQRVLEAGCGEGYGAAILARHAAHVVGADYDETAIGLAQLRHAAPHVEFRAIDLRELAEHAPGTFDTVTNFQVLEHLVDPTPFLRAAAACLRPGGRLILTTPNRLASVSENPFHVHEYVADELRDLIGRFFARVEMQGIVGTERVYAFEAARGARVRRILRLDPLGLRRLLPRSIVEFAFSRLALLVRSQVARDSADVVALEPGDFRVAAAEPPQFLDHLVIAHRG